MSQEERRFGLFALCAVFWLDNNNENHYHFIEGLIPCSFHPEKGKGGHDKEGIQQVPGGGPVNEACHKARQLPYV
ncbi:hypothetical protein [Brevibacillus sp. NRS-1366]|uniref:hypothetical protein n=1 Tax=Brevibacillus sp. NRS-1366 TaxID=3233899 RepID=UPI003D254D0C